MKNLAEECGIPIDGLVLTFDSVEYSESLGKTSRHPLHSMAFKFADEVAETTLTEIEWSVGRTGTITPVAIFEPVELDGTEVARASLHNLSIMEELELGIGDTISIIKANQIIPQVVDNATKSNDIIIPSICPSCCEETVIEQLNDSKVLKCTNFHCPAQLLGRFSHFVSRNAMNIEGLSEATLEKFIEQGFVRRFSDIYQLAHFENEVIRMEGFGVKSFNKLQESIKKSINVKMENFLYGLGIPHIGRSASKTNAKQFNGDWFAYEEAIVHGYDFTNLEDFGQVMHDGIIKWYLDADEHQLWEVVKVMLIFEQEKKETKSNNLKDLTGTTFVITGSVNTFKNRDEFKELVESLNGKVSGSVSAKTDYLVSNEASGSSKSKKAAELGVKVITEIEFNEMIGRSV
jgi:DNA ligase (NAD+)